MKKPVGATEIYLQPGDFFFGGGNTRIITLLGSCVAITMWHPVRRVGGMCHYLLPSRNGPTRELSGKYADEAMEMFLREIIRYKSKLGDYQIKLFGGGDMFLHENSINVSARNVEAAHRLLRKYRVEPFSQDLGAHGHRQIIFDIWNGDVWVRHRPIPNVKPCA